MSSTTGIQNLLVNVFRPVYQYDTTTSLFTPKLELSNIDTYSGNIVQATRADFGDTAGNMYVGSNAGNSIASIRACSNATALGQYAGNAISNVSNVTYLGYNAGNGAQGTLTAPVNTVIGIGVSAGGAGVSNIFIGNGTAATGSNNLLIGHGIAGGASNNLLQIGTTLYGNLSTKWIGIGTSTPYDPQNRLDVSGNAYLLGQLGINITPGTRTLDVNGEFRAQDAAGYKLDFTGGQVGVNRDPQRTMDISGTFRVQSNATTLLDVSTSAVTAPGGYTSVRGSISAAVGATTIGTLKRGLLHVAAIDQATVANQAFYTFFADTTSSVIPISSNLAGDTDITTSGTSIQISNITTTKTYDYMITYFPLP
jgi:hypothetical protein